MTPVKQQFLHDPPTSYGDCHRAALASLLDLTIDDVPNFMHGLGPKDGERRSRHLRARGGDWRDRHMRENFLRPMT